MSPTPPARQWHSPLTKTLKQWRVARKRRRKWRQALKAFPLPVDIEKELSGIINEIDFYWTTAEKQTFIANLIMTHQLKNAVEIGVYTGGSFIPQVVAMKRTNGVATGIDPYSPEEAEQSENIELLRTIKSRTLTPDREALYRTLLALIDRHGLSSHCKILRMTSNEAAKHIGDGIDFLHIDGNHDRLRVSEDIANYVPKVAVGGFVVMDDINWGTIAPLYADLKKQMKPVFETDKWGCCQKI